MRAFFAVGVVSGGRTHGEALIGFVLGRDVAAGYPSSADSVSPEVILDFGSDQKYLSTHWTCHPMTNAGAATTNPED